MTMQWPEFRVNLPGVGDVNINAAFFRRFDYSSSMVSIILWPHRHSYFKLPLCVSSPKNEYPAKGLNYVRFAHGLLTCEFSVMQNV